MSHWELYRYNSEAEMKNIFRAFEHFDNQAVILIGDTVDVGLLDTEILTLVISQGKQVRLSLNVGDLFKDEKIREFINHHSYRKHKGKIIPDVASAYVISRIIYKATTAANLRPISKVRKLYTAFNYGRIIQGLYNKFNPAQTALLAGTYIFVPAAQMTGNQTLAKFVSYGTEALACYLNPLGYVLNKSFSVFSEVALAEYLAQVGCVNDEIIDFFECMSEEYIYYHLTPSVQTQMEEGQLSRKRRADAEIDANANKKSKTEEPTPLMQGPPIIKDPDVLIEKAKELAKSEGAEGSANLISNKAAEMLAAERWGHSSNWDWDLFKVWESKLFDALNKKDDALGVFLSVGVVINIKHETNTMYETQRLLNLFDQKQPLTADTRADLFKIPHRHAIAASFALMTSRSIKKLSHVALSWNEMSIIFDDILRVLTLPTSKQEEEAVKVAGDFMIGKCLNISKELLDAESYQNERLAHSFAKGQWHHTPVSAQRELKRIHHRGTSALKKMSNAKVGAHASYGSNGLAATVTINNHPIVSTYKPDITKPQTQTTNSFAATSHELPSSYHEKIDEEDFNPDVAILTSHACDTAGEYMTKLGSMAGSFFKKAGAAIGIFTIVDEKIKDKNNNLPLVAAGVAIGADAMMTANPVVAAVKTISEVYVAVVPEPAPLLMPSREELMSGGYFEYMTAIEQHQLSIERAVADGIIRAPANLAKNITDGLTFFQRKSERNSELPQEMQKYSAIVQSPFVVSSANKK